MILFWQGLSVADNFQLLCFGVLIGCFLVFFFQYRGKGKEYCLDKRIACQAVNKKQQQQKAFDKTLIRNTVRALTLGLIA